MTAVFLIALLGYPGLAVMVFAESGFFLGAVLPGDSLLFAAGLIASRGALSIWIIVPLCIVMAIAGDSFGYWTGKRYGRKLFSRDDSFFFRKEFVDKTQAFYEKNGKKTIVLARFIPIIRTFAPIFAGIAEMPYQTFFSYNAVGGLIWATLLTLAGYFLGSAFPHIENYLSYIIAAIVVVSLVPIAVEYLKSRSNSKKA